MNNKKTFTALALVGTVAVSGLAGTSVAVAAEHPAFFKAGIVATAASTEFQNDNTVTIHPILSNKGGVQNTTGAVNSDPGGSADSSGTIKYTLKKVTSLKENPGGTNVLDGVDFSNKAQAASALAKASPLLKPGGKLAPGAEHTVGSAVGAEGLTFSNVPNGVYLAEDVSTNPTHVKENFWIVLPMITKDGNTIKYENDVHIYPKVPTVEMSKTLNSVVTESDGTQTATFRITVPIVAPAADDDRDFIVIDPLPAGFTYKSAELVSGQGNATGVDGSMFTFEKKSKAEVLALNSSKTFKAEDIVESDNIAVITGKTANLDAIYGADSANAGKTLVFDVKATYTDNKDDTDTATITNKAQYIPNKKFYRAENENAPLQAKTQESRVIKLNVKKVNAENASQTLSGAEFKLTQGTCATAESATALSKFYKADGSVSGSAGVKFVTGNDGTVSVLGLPEKTTESTDAKYCLTELNTVPGFKNLAYGIDLNVTNSGVNVDDLDSRVTGKATAAGYTITVKNDVDDNAIQGFILGIPLTGSQQTLVYVGIPALLALMGAAGIIAYRRKEKKNEA